MRHSRQRLEEFLFLPDSDAWLGFLRIGVALQVIFYCFSLRGDWNELFAIDRAGVIKRDLAEAILSAQSHYIPRFGWLVDLVTSFGGTEQTALAIVWWSLLCAVGLLLIGFVQPGSGDCRTFSPFVRGEKQQWVDLRSR